MTVAYKVYRAQSVIDEEKRVAEQKAEEERLAAEDARAADERMRHYRELDQQNDRHAETMRQRTEEARRERRAIERQAEARADEMEQEAAIERRAQQILAEREALLDPSLASAYDTSSAIPRTRDIALGKAAE